MKRIFGIILIIGCQEKKRVTQPLDPTSDVKMNMRNNPRWRTADNAFSNFKV